MPFPLLETPVPLVDLDRLEANLDRMAAHADRLGLTLRPHVKTHKTPWIAGEQLRRGAVGVTCATTAEAEVMAGVTGDILLAHPPVHPRKLERLLALPEEVSPMVGLDSEEAIDRLATAVRERGREVRVLVELDLGMRRVGVPGPEDAVRLARRIGAADSLEFAGVMFYPGHIKGPVPEQGAALERLRNDLGAVLHALARAGLPARIVSGGSTPTAGRTGEVVDAGTKALGREPFGDLAGFGELLDRPEVVVRAMSEEHGMLDLSETGWRPQVGEQVRIIPNHVCIVVHLNDLCVGIRGDRVERSWEVAGRGRKFCEV
jgi:D-serine deaminase-like pyridoxal phosphate-dependent protein